MATVKVEGETISQQAEISQFDGDEYLIVQKGTENKKIKTDKLVSTSKITNITEILED